MRNLFGMLEHACRLRSIQFLQGLIDCESLEVGDTVTMRPLFVVDTNYKIPDKPSQADINSAVICATLKDCREAVLVYPKCLDRPVDVQLGKFMSGA